MKQSVTTSVITAIAIISLGWMLKSGMDNFTYRDRTIEARGVAERVVKASVGSARLTVSIRGNNLVEMKSEILRQRDAIRQFAAGLGIPEEDITLMAPETEDRFRYVYQDRERPSERYSLKSGVSVYTRQVEALHALTSNAYQLIDKGVVVEQDYENNARYSYNDLDSIKPDMISEATANARLAASQFAKDSKSRIGLIKNANQGYFTISSIEGREPYTMSVRVVTSVNFYLDD